jgi:hypothetical protein
MSRLVMAGESRSNARGRRAPTQTTGARIMYGYIEDQKFAVEVFDERGDLKSAAQPTRIKSARGAGKRC